MECFAVSFGSCRGLSERIERTVFFLYGPVWPYVVGTFGYQRHNAHDSGNTVVENRWP